MKKLAKISKISINVRKPQDLGHVVGAITKAITKAGRHGSVEVVILAPDGSKLEAPEVPGTKTQVESNAEELKAAKAAHVETINELTQARLRIQELEALAKQQPEGSGAHQDDPGSQNEPSGDLPKVPSSAPAKKAAKKTATAKK
jgi:hypothetical protein